MSICSGCLSQGRRVKPLESIAMTRTLVWLQLNAFPACSMLCWECEADLARANRFRQRVEIAQFMFAKHKINENIIITVMGKEFALGDLSLSTMSTVQLGEENHIPIKQDDEGYTELEVEMKQELCDPIDLKEEVFDPMEYYSEECNSLVVNSNPTNENLHIKQISWSVQPQSPTVTPDIPIKSELAMISTNSYTTSTNSTTTSTNCTTTSANSTTTSANSTTQKSTREMTANSQKSIDFVPVENTAYQVMKVTEEEMFRYRECARNEHAFKSHTLKCESCIKLFKSEIEYEAHKTLHWHWSGPLLCNICSRRFMNENIFKQHCADHRKVYKCLKCSYQHPIKNTIYEHFKENHSIFLCQFCFMELDCEFALTDHMVAAHMEQKKSVQKVPHKCEQCEKIFKTGYELRKHQVTLSNRENRMKECPQCHKRVVKLDHHILKWHTRNQESFCETCMKQFLCVDSYKKHLKTSIVHNPASQPKGYCDKCNKQFDSLKYYKKHLINMHTNKPDKFECKHCLKLFQKQGNLQEHIDVVHDKKHPFACEYDRCNFTTTRNKLLKAHILKKHDTHTYISSERKKDVICQYCGTGFYSSRTLRNHILIHTGEKLYHCALCDWKFAYRSVFITHLRGKHPEVVQPRGKRNKDLDHS